MQVGSYSNETSFLSRSYRVTDKEVAGCYHVIDKYVATVPSGSKWTPCSGKLMKFVFFEF